LTFEKIKTLIKSNNFIRYYTLISNHFKIFWMGRWVNVFSKVIYTNFKLFVFISLSKKSSCGWKFSVLILSMLSFKHFFNISRNVWD
jgi:hypothetical protein